MRPKRESKRTRCWGQQSWLWSPPCGSCHRAPNPAHALRCPMHRAPALPLARRKHRGRHAVQYGAVLERRRDVLRRACDRGDAAGAGVSAGTTNRVRASQRRHACGARAARVRRRRHDELRQPGLMYARPGRCERRRDGRGATSARAIAHAQACEPRRDVRLRPRRRARQARAAALSARLRKGHARVQTSASCRGRRGRSRQESGPPPCIGAAAARQCVRLHESRTDMRERTQGSVDLRPARPISSTRLRSRRPSGCTNLGRMAARARRPAERSPRAGAYRRGCEGGDRDSCAKPR
jgi:hypothetical protein